MKVLVTGGAGFIGSHLSRELLRLGHNVVILDNLSTGLKENIPAKASTVIVDIRDRNKLESIFSAEKPEVVFHLAAQMNVRRSIQAPSSDADINILGSLQVLEVSAVKGVRRVIFASSGGAIYGNQARYPCLETDEAFPSSPYGIAKLAVEQYGRHFSSKAGLEFTALRLANVYGPGQNPDGEAGIVAIFLRELGAGRIPTIFGDGSQTRDFIWVDDVVQAFVKVHSGEPGTYNIGTGREVSILGIYQQVSDLLGMRSAPHFVGAILGEVRRNSISYGRAKEILGWEPEVELKEGLRKLLETERCPRSASSP